MILNGHTASDGRENLALQEMNGKVWLPESSLADCKALQPPPAATEKERRKKITRRTTPTVEFRAENSNEKRRKQTYSTIESSSYSRLSLHLSLNDTRAGEHHTRTEFCGWETSERGSLQSPSIVRRCTGEQAASNGQRSALQSRAGGRGCGKNRRNSVYEFKHLSDPSAYLQDYCSCYSYSALVISRENGGTDAVAPPEAEKLEKCEQKTRGSSRKPRREDATCEGCLVERKGRDGLHEEHLQQLADRLGVKESIQEGQLRYRPRRTPPSFTRKTRVAEDIMISTQDARSPPQIQESGSQTPAGIEQQQNGEQALSRADSAAQRRPHTTYAAPASLELPRIPHPSSCKNKNKTLSTSSVTKYLRISSRPGHSFSLGLGEEESAADVISSHDSLTSETIPEEKEEEVVEKTTTNGAGEETGEEHKFLLDVSWRQRMLAEKAQALGLLSRDWAQTRMVKRTIGDWQSKSRPPTRANTRPCTRDFSSRMRDAAPAIRPCTRADTRIEELRQNTRPTNYRLKGSGDYNKTTTSRPTTRGNTGYEKLNKIRAIYEPVEYKRNLIQTEQRKEVVMKRPVTRCGETSSSHNTESDKTRPGTRLGEKVQRKLENDGSQYWNEVPRIGHFAVPQSRTGTRAHLRLGPHSTTAESAKTRPPSQRVRLYPSRQLKRTVQQYRNPSFELSGQHRHQNRYS